MTSVTMVTWLQALGSRYTGPMSEPQPNLSAREALARLVEGNRRYLQNVRSVDSMLSHSRRDVQGQRPIAIVLGCSDSRAPAEVVFDQGLGDLFVIRVAGNIVAPSQIGSVEFAAERFGTRLVVVMGHSSCGAIEAAIEAVARKPGPGVAQPHVDRRPRAAEHRVAGGGGGAGQRSGASCAARPCAPTCARR